VMAVRRNKGSKKSTKNRKVSRVKLSNKKLSKLAKQGKLGQLKKRRQLLRAKSGEPNDEETDDVTEEVIEAPLEDADYEYFGTGGKGHRFLASYGERDKNGKRKIAEDEIEDRYEQLPRKQARVETKALLPVKDKQGVKQRHVVVQSNGADEAASDNEEEEAKSVEPPAPASITELFLTRQQRVAEVRQKVAVLASAVVENPQDNTKKLKELRAMLEETDPHIFLTVRKLAMVSLLEVFTDIVPGYHIRQATDKERQQTVKKETKKLREYEETLLRHYRLYLEFLEATLKSGIKHGNGVNKKLPEQAGKVLSHLAVKCLCRLLVENHHFNYTSNIITILMPYSTHNDPMICTAVQDAVKTVFKIDHNQGHITLQICILLSRLIKNKINKGVRVDPKAIDVFLALRIKEVDFDKSSKKDKMTHKEKMQKFSRRNRKRNKEIERLDKELEDVAATTNRKKRIELHTKIVEAVFLTYFRILKNSQKSPLISAVLEGLAKFSHLISIDFFDDLFNALNGLLITGDLDYKESLHCIQTVFTMMSGPGDAFNVDPANFYTQLYTLISNFTQDKSKVCTGPLLDCLMAVVVKRRKQLSLARLLSYIKRLCTVSLQLPTYTTVQFLKAANTSLQSHPKADMLYDSEDFGGGVYMQDCGDPEMANTHNTALYELYNLRHHYNPSVRKLANQMSQQTLQS
ncbi:unnamed protein product, partial [Owenia fusiformis]